MSRYTAWGVQLIPSGGDTYAIGGVTEQSIDNGVEVTAEVTAGQVSPQYGEINKIEPGGTFTCHDIIKVLTALGTKGACLAGGDAAGFGIYSLKKTDCGTIASGTVHRKLIIPNGRAVPKSLSVQQGKRASISVAVMSLFDGTNLPLIISTAIAAPTGLEDLSGFHLGEIVVGGVTLLRNESLECNFGNEIVGEYDDGEVYPRSLHINSHSPTLNINTRDLSKFGSGGIPLVGLKAEHADSYFVLRQKAIGTGAYMDSTDHIKVTFAGVVTCKETSASGNGPKQMSVMVTALDDGTNAMLVPDLAYELA